MTRDLLELTLGWCALTLLMGAALWRIVRGPTLFDRILGFDAAIIALVGFIIVFSISRNSTEFIELILVVTALGFFTTVAYYYYLTRSGTVSKGGDKR